MRQIIILQAIKLAQEEFENNLEGCLNDNSTEDEFISACLDYGKHGHLTEDDVKEYLKNHPEELPIKRD